MPYYLEKSWKRSHKSFPEGMHLGMINNTLRLGRYYDFFAAHAADKVILDVGAGLGLIGFKALEYGAKHVYFVEQNATTAAALRGLINAHPKRDQITLIEGDFHSTKAKQYPIQADYLVCELWGPHIWNEGLHATHLKARTLFPKIDIYPSIYRSNFNIVRIPWSEGQIWPQTQLAGVNLVDIYKKEYLGYLLDREGVQQEPLTEPVECFALHGDFLISKFETTVEEDYTDVFFHLSHEIQWEEKVDYFRSTFFYVPVLKRGQKITAELDEYYLPLFHLS